MDDFDQTQALDFDNYDDETDEDNDGETKPVGRLRVPMQKGFPEKIFPVYEGDNVIGRHESCSICIPLKALSREHACIEVKGDIHFLYDKGSRNKTRKGKHFLTPSVRYEVKHEDVLMFGDVTAVYLVGPPGTADDDTGSETGSESMFQTAPVDLDAAGEAEGNKIEELKQAAGDTDDGSDGSSAILEPSQHFAASDQTTLLGKEKTSLFVEDSDMDDSRIISASNITVEDTPAPTKRRKAQAEDAAGDRSLIIASTQAYICESDVDTGDELDSPQKKSFMVAETQAYGEDEDSDSEANKTSILAAATQAYMPDVDEEEEEEDEKKGILTEPTQAYNMGTGIEPTQAYDMDDENSNTSADTIEKAATDKELLYEATQAYGVLGSSAKPDQTVEPASSTASTKKGGEETKYDSDSSEEFILDENDIEENPTAAGNLFMAPTLACDTDGIDEYDDSGDSRDSRDKPEVPFTAAQARKGDEDGATQVFDDATLQIEEKRQGNEVNHVDGAPTQHIAADSTQIFEDQTLAVQNEDETATRASAADDVEGKGGGKGKVEKGTRVSLTEEKVAEDEGKHTNDTEGATQVFDTVTETMPVNEEEEEDQEKSKKGKSEEKTAKPEQEIMREETNAFDIMAASTLVETEQTTSENGDYDDNDKILAENDDATQCIQEGVEEEEGTMPVTDTETLPVAKEDATVAMANNDPTLPAADQDAATLAVVEVESPVRNKQPGKTRCKEKGKVVKNNDKAEPAEADATLVFEESEVIEAKTGAGRKSEINETEEVTQVFEEANLVENGSKRGKGKTSKVVAEEAATQIFAEFDPEAEKVDAPAPSDTETLLISDIQEPSEQEAATQVFVEDIDPTMLIVEKENDQKEDTPEPCTQVYVDDKPLPADGLAVPVKTVTKGRPSAKSKTAVESTKSSQEERREGDIAAQAFVESEPKPVGSKRGRKSKVKVEKSEAKSVAPVEDTKYTATRRVGKRRKQVDKTEQEPSGEESTQVYVEKEEENAPPAVKEKQTTRRGRKSKTVPSVEATQVYTDDMADTESVSQETEETSQTDNTGKKPPGRKSGQSVGVADDATVETETVGRGRRRGRPGKGKKTAPANNVTDLGEASLPGLSLDTKTTALSDVTATQIFGTDDDTPPLSEEFVPDSEKPSPIIALPERSPHKSALVDPKRKKSPSPKRVQFQTQESEDKERKTEESAGRGGRGKRSIQSSKETVTTVTNKKRSRKSLQEKNADDTSVENSSVDTSDNTEMPEKQGRVTRGKFTTSEKDLSVKRVRRSLQTEARINTRGTAGSSLPASVDDDGSETNRAGKSREISEESVGVESSETSDRDRGKGCDKEIPVRGKGRRGTRASVAEGSETVTDVKDGDNSQTETGTLKGNQLTRSKGRQKEVQKKDSKKMVESDDISDIKTGPENVPPRRRVKTKPEENDSKEDNSEKSVKDDKTKTNDETEIGSSRRRGRRQEEENKEVGGIKTVEESDTVPISGRSKRTKTRESVDVKTDIKEEQTSKSGRSRRHTAGKADDTGVDKTSKDRGTKDTDKEIGKTSRGGKRRAAENSDNATSSEQMDSTQDDQPSVKKGKKSEKEPSGVSTPKSSRGPSSVSTPKGTPGSAVKTMSTPKGASKKDLDTSNSCSPSLRKSTIENKPKVMFTGVTDDQGEKIVKELGGELASSVYDCTHLVTDQIRRTVKFLCCLARGIPIVTPQWLVCSKRSGMFIDPSPFLIKDYASEKKHKFTLQRSLGKARDSQLLAGHKIHVTKSVKPEPAQMKDILQCAGAVYLPTVPKAFNEDTIVISCEADRSACEASLKSGITVVQAEFILTGVLRQEADIKEFILFGPSENGKKRKTAGEGAPAAKRSRR